MEGRPSPNIPFPVNRHNSTFNKRDPAGKWPNPFADRPTLHRHATPRHAMTTLAAMKSTAVKTTNMTTTAMKFASAFCVLVAISISPAPRAAAQSTSAKDDAPSHSAAAEANTDDPTQCWVQMTGKFFKGVKSNAFFQKRLGDNRWGLGRAYNQSDAQDGIMMAMVASQMAPATKFKYFRFDGKVPAQYVTTLQKLLPENLKKHSVVAVVFSNEQSGEERWIPVSMFRSLLRK